MAQYPAIYTDEHGIVKTTIHNEYNESSTDCLIMEIDGVKFKGSSFDDFELLNPENYTEHQLKRFTFNKVSIFQTDIFAWELCKCSIELNIPQIVFDANKEIEIEANLGVQIFLGNPMRNGGLSDLDATFILSFNGRKFQSESGWFETAFSQLQKEMLPQFRFKNCFSCHYSDYSPAGNGFFASMMCFRNNKASYLTATKKEEFFRLAHEGFISVQETYYCNQFEPREKGTGYRGWPFDQDAIQSSES